jgi:hypothetical protein
MRSTTFFFYHLPTFDFEKSAGRRGKKMVLSCSDPFTPKKGQPLLFIERQTSGKDKREIEYAAI